MITTGENTHITEIQYALGLTLGRTDSDHGTRYYCLWLKDWVISSCNEILPTTPSVTDGNMRQFCTPSQHEVFTYCFHCAHPLSKQQALTKIQYNYTVQCYSRIGVSKGVEILLLDL